jgi:hypothetical protein
VMPCKLVGLPGGGVLGLRAVQVGSPLLPAAG